MYIRYEWREDEVLDKVFVITPGDENNISWEISYNRWIINDLEFEFMVKNIKNEFWEWFIKEFEWQIEWKTITRGWVIDDQENSSKISYVFENYWDHNISVKLTNSTGKSKVLTEVIKAPKKLKLKQSLRILLGRDELEWIEYDEANNEYFINEIGVPTTLRFDARFVKADNSLYTLDKVEWCGKYNCVLICYLMYLYWKVRRVRTDLGQRPSEDSWGVF